jgi:hypothetical protein
MEYLASISGLEETGASIEDYTNSLASMTTG